MKTKTQLLLLMLIALFVTVALVAGVQIYYDYQQVRKNTENNLLHQAQVLSEQTDFWFNDIIQTGRFFTNQYNSGVGNKAEVQKLLGSLYNSFNNYDNLVLVTPEGIVTNIYPYSTINEVKSLTGKEYFRNTLQYKASQVSGVIESEVTGVPVIVVTQPVLDVQGRVQAVLLQCIKIDYLQAMINSFKLGKTSNAIIFNNRGQYIMPALLSDTDNPIPHAIFELFHKDLHDPDSYLDHGSEVLVAVNRVNTTGWGIAVSISKSEVLETFYRSAKYGLAVFCLIYLILVLFTSAMLRRLFRSITLVTEHFAFLREGEYADAIIQEKIVRSAPKELKALCITFNQMAATVSEHINKLCAVNEALQKSEERWELALKGSRDGIWDWNVATGSIFYSEQAQILLGGNTPQSIEELLKSAHYNDRETIHSTLLKHLRHQLPTFHVEFRFRQYGNSYIWLVLKGQSLWNENGRVIRMVGSVSDITKSKQAEEALRLAKDHLETKVEQRTRQLVAINEELQAMNFELQEINSSYENEIIERKKIENQLESLNGELLAALDDLQQAQTRLIQSEKLASLGNLVAGVAHEVNTPIGIGVTAASHLEAITQAVLEIYHKGELRKKDLEEYFEDCSEAAKIIKSNMDRASQLVKSFKQISSDQSSELRRVFHVKQYLIEIVNSVKPKLKNSGITVHVSGDENVSIDGYPGAFSQIITNLIMNSLMHGFEQGETGEISIEVSKEKENLLRLVYIDTGKGMEKKVLEKIFDPFFTTKRGAGGTGLGMYILYNIITQQFNGTVECNSEPGNGTIFVIRFPLDRKEKQL